MGTKPETAGGRKSVFCSLHLSVFSIQRIFVDVACSRSALVSALSSEVKSFNSIPFSN
jgi:hypothetical protein